MEKRLSKMLRLQKVQEQLYAIEEMRLANLQRRSVELETEQQVLIQTLNNESVLHGLFVESRARRLQSLAVQASEVEKAQDKQRRIALDRAMQVKRTERIVDTISIECRRADEKKDYLALLDSLAAKNDASLP